MLLRMLQIRIYSWTPNVSSVLSLTGFLSRCQSSAPESRGGGRGAEQLPSANIKAAAGAAGQGKEAGEMVPSSGKGLP